MTCIAETHTISELRLFFFQSTFIHSWLILSSLWQFRPIKVKLSQKTVAVFPILITTSASASGPHWGKFATKTICHKQVHSRCYTVTVWGQSIVSQKAVLNFILEIVYYGANVISSEKPPWCLKSVGNAHSSHSNLPLVTIVLLTYGLLVYSTTRTRVLDIELYRLLDQKTQH